MAAPFTPDPADSPSGRLPDANRASSPTTNHKHSHDIQGATPLAVPTPAEFDPPTVISSMRQKRSPFDANLGETLAGRKLGHFELIESVGTGGMGAVLKARDLDLGRVVALKILPPDMAADPENIIRFKQEARAAAKLDHDNVARVYHFGEDQGLHFIAFEFVEGDNLRQMMEANGGTIPVADAVALMLDVAAGLGHAAERGVVHRDIKPSNVIVTPDGRAKIVDMGLARSMDARHVGQLTESGVTLGTFDYISPEQAIEPRSADVRSDIYSLGCTFYHALTGHTPVPEGTAAKKLDAQRNLLAPDPRLYNPAIPEDVAAILGRMMAKDPDRRYQDPEYLAVHLRAVARKLGIATGPLSSPGLKLDGPLPPPPRMNAAWVLTAVAVLALAIVIFSNAFRPNPTPPILDEKPGAFLSDPIDPGPITASPVAVVQRDAADTEQLLAMLRQGTQHIRLTGREYDLARYRDHEGQPVEAVLSGDNVRLEGVSEPIVRLGYSPDGKSRMKTLTLRGPGVGKGSASVRGIRFQLPDADGDDADSGLLVSGFENVNIEECTFSTGYRSSRDGPAGLGLVLRGGTARLSKCYFAPGCVGFWIDGPGKVSANECAIGPQFAGIRVLRSSPDLVGETELTLTHCSALLPATGALVEVGDQVPCTITAAYCLFGGPEKSGTDDIPVVLRQWKTRATTTKYVGESDSKPNFYYNMAAYSEREEIYSFAEAVKQKLPVHDVERAIKHPWEDPDPFRLLKATPPDSLRAFTQNVRLSELRMKNDANQEVIVGAKYLGPHQIFALPLPSPKSEVRDLTVKVWDPSLSDTADNLPPGVYPTFTKALAAVRSGDTLLIRHSGRLEVDPYEFTRADTKLTIKPDVGYKPILVPAAVTLKPAAGLFKLYGGKLVLDGLHFRLPADRAPAIVVLPGGGQLELKNAVITLEDGEDLSAIKLVDPRGEMMMGGGASTLVPKVTVENVFLRGKGQLLAVKGSRPFEMDVKNVLAAVDDTLIEIEPSMADPSSLGSGIVRLARVTAYLGGSLLCFRASDKKTEMGPTGLTRTEITATQCVFVPAGGSTEALVRAERIDTREQAEKWLTYRGKNNVYGQDKKKVMLEIRPTDVEAMPIQPIEGDRWLAMTLEEGDPFTNVSFEYRLPESGQTRKFLAVRPIDFRTIRFDPLRENFSDTGSTAEIASPFADE